MTEGRTVWVGESDVQGALAEDNVVTAARSLCDWCLRGDDGGEPVKAGTQLVIVETRPYGACIAQEWSADDAEAVRGEIMQAAQELTLAGLWEFAEVVA